MSTQKVFDFTATIGDAALTNASVSIFRIGETSTPPLYSTQISDGHFGVELTVNDSDYFYVIVDVFGFRMPDGASRSNQGRALTLFAVFNHTDEAVHIGPQSTVACAYNFVQLITTVKDNDIRITGTDRNLRIAYAMKNNFFVTEGKVGAIRNSPNGLETNSYPLFNFLSNLVYYAYTDSDGKVYTGFTNLFPAYATFLDSLIGLAREPFTDPGAVYGLIDERRQLYSPSLTEMALPPHKANTRIPQQWTLTYKANDSGAQNFLPAGVANVVFDKEDKAWIANNFRAGSALSGTHCIVLNRDASPASFSPITGGGLLGAAFGAAIDPKKELISIGNFGWGPELFNPQHGSISRFEWNGTVKSPANGYTEKLSRVQGMCYDESGNLWMASVGMQDPFAPAPIGPYTFKGKNSAVVVYVDGDPNKALSWDLFGDRPSPYHSAFDVAIDSKGRAFVSTIGNADHGLKSTVSRIELVNGKLERTAHWESDYYNERTMQVGFEELRQVAINSRDEVFVGGITSSRLIRFSNDLETVEAVYTDNVDAPWGVTIDGNDTVFLANFAQEKGRAADDSLDMHGPFGVTVIRDPNNPDPKLMTVPTGGAEVMLANGFPLYGNQTDENGNDIHKKCYEPLMRMTATGIDGAGNLWAMNNWKPSIADDVKSNPGGDGVVIFIGVAKPK